MNWINACNTIASLALLFYLLAAGSQAVRWRHRLALLPLIVITGLQAYNPISEWIPELAWPGVAFNVALALAVTAYRRDLWHLIRVKFDPDHIPLERADDQPTTSDNLANGSA